MSGGLHKKVKLRHAKKWGKTRKNIAICSLLSLMGGLAASPLLLPMIEQSPVVEETVTRQVPVAEASRSQVGESFASVTAPASDYTVRRVELDESRFTEQDWNVGASNEIDGTQLVKKKVGQKPAEGKKQESQPAQQDTAQTVSPTTPQETPVETPTPATNATPSTPVISGDTGNAYPYGQCTWWAYERRKQLGLPVGSHFGNGAQWANSARALGYTVDSQPQVGAIVVFAPAQAGADSTYGHVAIVEAVNNDGTVMISEANINGMVGPFNRTLDAITSANVQYIH